MALFGKKENEEEGTVDKIQTSPQSMPDNMPDNTPVSKPTSTLKDRTPDTTYFGKNLKITGNVSGEGNLIIIGSFDGEFNLKGQLKVAQGAKVKGDVKASSISVSGNVEGAITASEKIHLENTARVNGRIRTPKVSILDGAVFDGEMRMSSRSVQPAKREPSAPAQKSTVSAAAETK